MNKMIMLSKRDHEEIKKAIKLLESELNDIKLQLKEDSAIMVECHIENTQWRSNQLSNLWNSIKSVQ